MSWGAIKTARDLSVYTTNHRDAVKSGVFTLAATAIGRFRRLTPNRHPAEGLDPDA